MERIKTSLGEMLREEFLPEWDLSIKEFAEEIGISEEDAQKLLEDDVPLNDFLVERLSDYFGVSPGYWWNLERNKR